MIVARLADLSQQAVGHAALQAALTYLAKHCSDELADGRYEVDGERIYLLVQRYTTLPLEPSAKYEAHQKYIDIQYIVEGVEGMGWAPLDQMAVTKPYNPEKDVVNGTCPPQEATVVQVRAGEAAIFFPSDAHAPKLACGQAAPVTKMVLKVAV